MINKMTKENLKTYLTTKEVAELLDVNEKVVYQLINEKGLPATKITGKWLFPRHLVERWLEEHVLNHPQGLGTRPKAIVILGSHDLLLERTLALFNRKAKVPVSMGVVGSLGGLRALRQGLCHLATAHLMESNEEEYNFAYLQEHVGEPLPAVVNFCFRTQGLILAPKYAQEVRDVKDIARLKLRLANRPQGTGTRLLLDHELKKAGLSPEKIPGYGDEYASHCEVGLAVLSGKAEVGVGIEAVAAFLGLSFVPWRRERYDLLIPKALFFDEDLQRFLGFLQEEEFRQLAREMPGYEVSQAGRLVFPKSWGGKPCAGYFSG